MLVSTQLPPQLVCPMGQVQLPAVQLVPLVHASLQPPQWSLLAMLSTQAEPQAKSPLGHLHAPASQV
jgi:hypothetical protein